MDDGLRTDGAGAADRLHALLLAMAGRVDDDAVNSTREMAGFGQLDAAAEFLVGCLLAGRIPVTSTEQYQLRRVLDEARSQHTLADRLQVVDSVPPERHRFSDQHESDDDLVAALSPVAARLTGVRALWCAWRTSPAGVTYGAVPRRVLLAEVGAEGSAAAVGYQLLDALRRAGINCSVDVFNSGSELPEYHRDAVASARQLHLNVPVDVAHTNANHARAPRGTSGGEPSRAEPARADELSSPVASEASATSIPEPGDSLPRRDPVPGDSGHWDTGHRDTGHRDTGHRDTGHRDSGHWDSGHRDPGHWAPGETGAPEAGVPQESGLPSEQAMGMPEPMGMPGEPSGASVGAPGFANEPTLMTEPAAAPSHEAGQSHEAGRPHEPATVNEESHDSENMRVPAAVDAKLTDRERNLLRKLHEELAHREQEDGSGDEQQQAVPSGVGQPDSFSTMPGTGGFPPIQKH